MNAPRSTLGRVSIAALALVAVVGTVAAASALRPSGPTAAIPTVRPSATPSAAPSGAPSPKPTAAPTKAPSAPGSVVLENATGHDVSILIHDQIGVVNGAVSGKPGDGMSVGWHKALVENVDAKSISVTWVGLPGDDVADLGINGAPGAYVLTLVQAGPVANSDAMGEDRVLILTFDAPVSAADVSVEILDRTVDY